MLEDYLVRYCAPTLMDIKPGSLFSHPAPPGALYPSLLALNRELNSLGIFLEALKSGRSRTLIYVYRKERLSQVLEEPEPAELLDRYGYQPGALKHYISVLESRLRQENAFPHEIGVFLGYPVKDVSAFIDNKGRNSLAEGCWKVYTDVAAARRVFDRYDRCTERCVRLYREGSATSALALPS